MARVAELINDMLGTESVKYTHGSAVEEGGVLYVAGLGVLIAHDDLGASEEGLYYTKGRFKFPITAAVTIAQGDKVYYDVSANTVRKSNDTNLTVGDYYLGRAAAAGSASGGYVDVFINEDVPLIEQGWKALAADLTLTLKEKFIKVSGNAAAVTLTLPAAASSIDHEYFILCTDVSHAVTIDGNASETIGGATTYVFGAADELIHIKCDGTGWQILNKPYKDAISLEHLDDGILPGAVIRAAVRHTWAGGAATTDTVTVTGVDATDVILAQINVRGSGNPTTVISAERSAANSVLVTLDQNGQNTVTKISVIAVRAAA